MILNVTVFLLACLLFFVNPTSATLISIDFESDIDGPKSNGFTPAGISGVYFSDSKGADLSLWNFGGQGSGQRSLYVGSDGDLSALQISLAFLADSISLAFGNDDPNNTNPGDLALLRVSLGTTQVGQDVIIILNRDDLMDQTISFGSIGGSVLFDNILFAYGYDNGYSIQFVTGVGTSAIGLAEVVDNIEINGAVTPIPEPCTLILLSSGFLGTALFRKFHRKAKI